MGFGKFTGESDLDIITNLLSNGSQRRKAEEKLFSMFSYFIGEGMKKYSITEDESFDVYSDTILVAIEKIGNGTFEGRSSLKTYVYQIFLNKCVDLIRKKTTNKNKVHQTFSITDKFMELSDATKPVIQKMIEQSDWNLLKARLNELGENCRKLLLLFADGLQDKEIALELAYKTADVVKTSRLRCLERLRLMYKKVP